MEIINIIDKCEDGRERLRELDDIFIIAVHRIWFDDVDLDKTLTAEAICRRFIDDPKVAKYTGGEVPYTLFVDKDGKIYQSLQLREVAPHARRWNTAALGVGVMGDFRKTPPTAAQRSSLVDLCANLCMAFDLDPLGDTELPDTVRAGAGQYVRGSISVHSLAGHDELPGGSKDTRKRCPGQYLPMEQLRFDVNDAIRRNAMAQLIKYGVTV